jgi:hypothetical protein
MTLEEALAALERILGKGSLNDLQELIVRQSWEQKTYPEIAASSGYDDGYVKYVGFQLWKTLSDALGERVSKNNFRAVLRRWRSHSLNNTSREVPDTTALTPPPFLRGKWGVKLSTRCRREARGEVSRDSFTLLSRLG